MRRLLISFLLACSCLSADVSLLEAASPAEKGPETAGTSTEALNPVVQWNRILLVVVRTPGAQPATIHPTRSFAIMHAAIYDAVNAIDRTHKPYLVRLSGILRSASQDAAAAAAAHDILASLYPNFPKQPQFTHWSHVTPFALERANQFRPGGPPVLTSDTYSDAFNEVKLLGIGGGTASTPDQALTGRFWNGAIQNYWNEISQTAALAHRLTTAESARLFALLNLTFADDVIAFYDAKYTYNFWRPVTAIRAAATDNNPDTAADPNWLPEVGNTTPDPSYPGAHAVISAAGASVLISFFGKDRFEFTVTSEVLPGVERSFTSISAAAEEATLSRIFGGQHFRFDLTTGQRLGRDVADFVLDNFLTPAHGKDESDDR